MLLRSFVGFFVLLSSLALPRLVRAEEPAPQGRERGDDKRDDGRAVDIGVLGGVGFPRPLAVEPVVRVRKIVMLGAEYSVLPRSRIAAVDTRMWAAAADVRVFPFKDGFFLGLRAGYQALVASATVTAANIGSYSESIEIDTLFLNPRVGFLWVWKPFAVGIDIGAQLPIATSISRTSLLPAVAPELDGRVASTSRSLARMVLPTLDLVRIGLVF